MACEGLPYARSRIMPMADTRADSLTAPLASFPNSASAAGTKAFASSEISLVALLREPLRLPPVLLPLAIYFIYFRHRNFPEETANMPLRIERLKPRDGLEEKPAESERGYELVDGRIPDEKHHVKHSTFVRSLSEAAYLVEQGYWIRMSAPGKRASLISPKSLRIVRT